MTQPNPAWQTIPAHDLAAQSPVPLTVLPIHSSIGFRSLLRSPDLAPLCYNEAILYDRLCCACFEIQSALEV